MFKQRVISMLDLKTIDADDQLNSFLVKLLKARYRALVTYYKIKYDYDIKICLNLKTMFSKKSTDDVIILFLNKHAINSNCFNKECLIVIKDLLKSVLSNLSLKKELIK